MLGYSQLNLEDPPMADTGSNPMRRRAFIQNSAAATVAATGLTPAASEAQNNPPETRKPLEMPKRVLGKTGVEVTILNAGTARAPGALDRLLRFEYNRGVRFFDTAATYGTEEAFKKWFAAMPEVRKQIFLATKDGVTTPSDMLKRIDLRLEALGTDYIDLLYFHALAGKAVDFGLTGNEMEWPRSKEMKETIEAIKKTGKVRFVGFATHDRLRAEQFGNCRRGELDGCDHAHDDSVGGEGFETQPGHRCLPQEEHRPGGDEAGGRQPGEARGAD